jgi:cytochrome b561
MKTIKPSIAATELLLIFPATLFMCALVVRSLQPQQYEPARTAQRIVDWYAARVHLGLWVLLIALPLTVLATGSVTLLRAWNDNAELRQQARQTLAAIRAHLATLFVAVATLASGVILAIVALHMMTG